MWVSITIIRDIIYGAVRFGARLEALCDSVGLTPAQLEQPDLRLDMEQGHRVWAAALALTQDPCLGLHIGEMTSPTILGLVGHLMQSSPNMQQAFGQVGEFNRAVTEMFFYRFSVENEAFVMEFEPAAWWLKHHPDTAFQAVSQSLCGSLHICRLLTGKPIYPFRVEVAFPKPPTANEYQRLLKGDIRWNQPRNRLYFSLADSLQPVVGYHPSLWQLFRELCGQLLDQQATTVQISDQVKAKIAEIFPDHPPTLHEVADALHLTERSLQRRLKDEGTTFQDLLEEVRKGLALSLLEQKKLAVNEIAYLLGYAEPSVFRRAFKRWTGQSPKGFRASNDSSFLQPS